MDGESSKIELNWPLSDLNNFICQCYPLISLDLIGFELARAGKRRKLQKLQAGSVRELKMSVGKSRLYILPRVEVIEVWIHLISKHCHFVVLLISTGGFVKPSSVSTDHISHWNAPNPIVRFFYQSNITDV